MESIRLGGPAHGILTKTLPGGGWGFVGVQGVGRGGGVQGVGVVGVQGVGMGG